MRSRIASIRLSLGKDAVEHLDRLVEELPTLDRGKALRAMILFFTERVLPRQEWADLAETAYNRHIFKGSTRNVAVMRILGLHIEKDGKAVGCEVDAMDPLSGLPPQEIPFPSGVRAGSIGSSCGRRGCVRAS